MHNINIKRLLLAFSATVLGGVYLYEQNNWIKVDSLRIPVAELPKELEGYKIVQISDVHLPKNAGTIKHLVSLIQKQQPDLIVMTGDILNRADVSGCGLGALCRGLARIAPVYAVTGNHESHSPELLTWKEALQQNGVTLLDGRCVVIPAAGTKLALIGLPDGKKYDSQRIENMEAAEGLPVILLAHHPELWRSYCSTQNSVIPAIVFSGHAHGGQFRIPFVGGLIAPNQGWFPKYTSGAYFLENGCRMVVSRGLGKSIIPFRINNRPHLPVIRLTCGE